MESEIYAYTDGGKEFRITTDEDGTPWVGIEVTVDGRTSCVGMPLTFAALHDIEDALTAIRIVAAVIVK